MLASHKAAKAGNLTELTRLIEEENVSPTTTQGGNDGYTGNTPLIYAAEAGKEDVLTYLLDTCKVDIDQINAAKQSAIYHAAMKNKAGAVRLLLAKRAKVNIIDDTMGYTPLMRAAQDGQFEALTALLESGKCNLEIRDELNMFGTALLVAAAHDHWDCVCKLLKTG